MKMKLTAAAFAAFLLLGASSGGSQALALGGPGGGGGMCVAMCSAAEYERNMAIMQQLYAMLEACGTDDGCRDAAFDWAAEKLEESRKLADACYKSCEPGP